MLALPYTCVNFGRVSSRRWRCSSGSARRPSTRTTSSRCPPSLSLSHTHTLFHSLSHTHSPSHTHSQAEYQNHKLQVPPVSKVDDCLKLTTASSHGGLCIPVQLFPWYQLITEHQNHTLQVLPRLLTHHARPVVGVFQSQFLPGLSTFDNNSQQNGSKNGETAPRPGTGYPNEGPSVGGLCVPVLSCDVLL